MALDPSMLLAYQQAFSTDWYHLSQQKESKFGAFAIKDNFTGESKRYTRLGPQEFQKRDARKSKNKVTEPGMDFRHAFNDDYSLVNVIDKIDARKIGDLTAPESQYVKSHGFAHNRLGDKIILRALLGNATTGEKPTGSTALGSARLIVQGSTGFNITKLRQMKLALDNSTHLSLNPDKRVLALAPQDLDDAYASVSASDITERQQIRDVMNGNSDMLYGFKIVPYTEWDLTLTGASSTNRRIVGWTMGAVVVNNGDVSSRLTELDEQNFDLQIYSSAYAGAVRMEEELVIACDCLVS